MCVLECAAAGGSALQRALLGSVAARAFPHFARLDTHGQQRRCDFRTLQAIVYIVLRTMLYCSSVSLANALKHANYIAEQNPHIQVCWSCVHLLVIVSVLRQVTHSSSLSQTGLCSSTVLLLQLFSSQHLFLQETLTLMKLMLEYPQEYVRASMTECGVAPRWTAAALRQETSSVPACSCMSLSQDISQALHGFVRT